MRPLMISVGSSALALSLVTLPTPAEAVLYDQAGKRLVDGAYHPAQVNWRDARYDAPGAIGVLRRDGKRLGCTAALVRATTRPGSPTYLLSAGHCVEATDAMGSVIVNERADALEVELAGETYAVERVAYATRTDADVALFELASREIASTETGAPPEAPSAAGLVPLLLSGRAPRLGEALELVGVPQVGLPKRDRHLWRSACSAEGFGNLDLEEVHYTRDLVAHRCSTRKGSSGSPLLAQGGRELLAIHVATTRLVGLGQTLGEVRACFDEAGRFDLEMPGCALPRGCGDGTRDACLRSACRDGRGGACHELGVRSGFESAGAAMALSYMDRACSLEYAPGCRALAVFHANGWGTPSSPARALTFEERACDLNELSSCYQLGRRYMYGLGVPMSDVTARRYLRRACSGGERPACDAASQVYGDETG